MNLCSKDYISQVLGSIKFHLKAQPLHATNQQGSIEKKEGILLFTMSQSVSSVIQFLKRWVKIRQLTVEISKKISDANLGTN